METDSGTFPNAPKPAAYSRLSIECEIMMNIFPCFIFILHVIYYDFSLLVTIITCYVGCVK